MYYIKIRNIQVYGYNLPKSFSRDQILFDINLNIQKGEIFGIIGPSGCGKTVLLKTIAGVITPEEGDIFVNENPITGIKPSKRKISMVFQDFILYPNMTNLMNLRYPVIIHKSKEKPQKEMRTEDLSALLHIDEQKLLRKYPRYTSLGERQRISIGKALISIPDILLLDEPLSNVEDSLREEIRHNLRSLVKEYGMTAVYVSHNQLEIAEISDSIAVMNSGTIEQAGTYDELYNNPGTLFVSTMIGDKSNNILLKEEVEKLTEGKIHYAMTIRPGECLLEKNGESIEIEGEITFIENLIQEGKKLAFIEREGKLFGVEVPLDYPMEKNQIIKIYMPINKAKFFEEISEDRVYNLW